MRVLGPTKVWVEEDITVKRRRHTPEQIVRKLREVERLTAEGQTIVCLRADLEAEDLTVETFGFLQIGDE